MCSLCDRVVAAARDALAAGSVRTMDGDWPVWPGRDLEEAVQNFDKRGECEYAGLKMLTEESGSWL